LETLAPSQREHYLVLKELRDKILENYRKLPGGRVLAAASEHRIEALLTSFLKLLATLNSYRKYLNASDRKTVERELEELVAEAEKDTNPRLVEVKKKRAEILQKRVQRFRQAEESREIVSHQLAGIEDVLRLTHEQSIAIRDPESVSRQLEALTAEVQATDETVREMEKFMEFAEMRESLPSQGARVR
jgi:maltooligosyltrehalose synthase